MKTPRDILLERHQSSAPKLDSIRREVLAGLEARVRREPCSHWVVRLWVEVFWSCRRIWGGLALVWVGLCLFNLAQRDPADLRLARSPASVPTMATLQEQERMLNELLADRSVATEAIRPREYVPKPRSAVGGITAV